jgi:hypothetical protein
MRVDLVEAWSGDLTTGAFCRRRRVRAAAMFWKDSGSRSSSGSGRDQNGVGPFGQVRVLIVGDSGVPSRLAWTWYMTNVSRIREHDRQSYIHINCQIVCLVFRNVKCSEMDCSNSEWDVPASTWRVLTLSVLTVWIGLGFRCSQQLCQCCMVWLVRSYAAQSKSAYKHITYAMSDCFCLVVLHKQTVFSNCASYLHIPVEVSSF